ncbi:hypothetical protein [Streptomyces asoensis]|uniref:hypothetical protein n=1 Tax=Streptomyces asoensis TaxID=249586 RepID=UPI0033F4C8EE
MSSWGVVVLAPVPPRRSLVAVWFAAMALGGIIGGLVLHCPGAAAVAVSAAAAGAVFLLVAAGARHHAFCSLQAGP